MVAAELVAEFRALSPAERLRVVEALLRDDREHAERDNGCNGLIVLNDSDYSPLADEPEPPQPKRPRKPRCTLPPAERDQQIRQHFDNGLSYQEIAEQVGCSDALVGQVVKREGWQRRPISRNRRVEKTAGLEPQIRQLFQAGIPYAKIASELGCSVGFICELVKREGWSRRTLRRQCDNSLDHKIRELFQAGLSYAAIAERCGCSHAHAYRTARRLGLERPPA